MWPRSSKPSTFMIRFATRKFHTANLITRKILSLCFGCEQIDRIWFWHSASNKIREARFLTSWRKNHMYPDEKFSRVEKKKIRFSRGRQNIIIEKTFTKLHTCFQWMKIVENFLGKISSVNFLKVFVNLILLISNYVTCSIFKLSSTAIFSAVKTQKTNLDWICHHLGAPGEELLRVWTLWVANLQSRMSRQR